jgi:hypothetical protein
MGVLSSDVREDLLRPDAASGKHDGSEEEVPIDEELPIYPDTPPDVRKREDVYLTTGP